MFIRIRKETFGYILFERFTRMQHVAATTERLENFTRDALAAFLRQYFGEIDEEFEVEFVQPPQSQLELAVPFGMYLEITPFCNMSCLHCYKPAGSPETQLTLDEQKQLIKELHDLGVLEIRLCGNEPTASPIFFDLCRYIRTFNFYLGINTNAYFDEEKREALVALQPDLVVVSVDGDQESHDTIRRTGSYQKAVALLERLSQTTIKHRINTVLSRATLGRIEHIVRLAERTGSDVSFIPLRAIGKSTCFKQGSELDKATMLASVREITALRSRYPRTTLLTYFDILGKKSTYYHSMDFNQPCPARKNGFITYAGDLFPCDFLRYLGDRFHCGSVKTAGFYPLWHQSQTLHDFQHLEHSNCKSCKHFLTNCYGGCVSSSLGCGSSIDDALCFVELV